MRNIAGLLVFVCSFDIATAFHFPTRPSAQGRRLHNISPKTHGKKIDKKIMSPTAVSLQQYAPDAISLFQNMVTPASILAGAIVPMSFASALPIKSANDKENRPIWILMRKAYNVAALLSLLSNLIAVMWSVIAVNQLTETKIAPASSVWHLLRRDFDLPWYVIVEPIGWRIVRSSIVASHSFHP